MKKFCKVPIRKSQALTSLQPNKRNLKKDAATCSKESLLLILNLIITSNWTCQSIDIKLAFLQDRGTDRYICQTNGMLNDAK